MKNSVLDRLKSYFNEYFSDVSKPTARNLFLIVVSILALDIFRSVRFAHRHMLSKLSDTSLNAYYYVLKTDSIDHESWRDVTVAKALRTVPESLEAQPLFLSIDDTMVEKKGEKFELRSKLFDHAAHNGSNYLNGHCFVSVLLCGEKKNPLSCRPAWLPHVAEKGIQAGTDRLHGTAGDAGICREKGKAQKVRQEAVYPRKFAYPPGDCYGFLTSDRQGESRPLQSKRLVFYILCHYSYPIFEYKPNIYLTIDLFINRI